MNNLLLPDASRMRMNAKFVAAMPGYHKEKIQLLDDKMWDKQATKAFSIRNNFVYLRFKISNS